jgi:serine/threonine protein kinase
MDDARRSKFDLTSRYDDDALARVARAISETPVAAPASRKPPAVSDAPQVIDRYHLLEVIGEGGMGAVYRAEQREPFRRMVALKLIKPGLDTKQVIRRFEAERQALAMMDHPGVARVFDAGSTADGQPYFVMELVAGEPITSFCDRRRLTVRERLALFEQVCLAVHHAHQKGVIHRDLKPGNILVTEVDGRAAPKVIDFGLAKAINPSRLHSTRFTQYGQFPGTPAYMSPEQAGVLLPADDTRFTLESGSGDVDVRTDVYSLGVVLYELLTGVLPFPSRDSASTHTPQALRTAGDAPPPHPSTRFSQLGEASSDIATRRCTRPDTLSAELQRNLDHIPLKALSHDRDARYASVYELSQDIRRYLDKSNAASADISRVSRFALFSAVGLGLVLIVGALYWWSLLPGNDATKYAQRLPTPVAAPVTPPPPIATNAQRPASLPSPQTLVPPTPASPSPAPALPATASPAPTPAWAPATPASPAPASPSPAPASAVPPAPASPAPVGNDNDPDRDIADYTAAIRLEPDSYDLHNKRGWSYMERKRYAEAAADFTECVRLNPEYGTAYLNRGRARWEAGDAANAKADFDDAIRLKPERNFLALAHFYRAKALQKLGDPAGARLDHARALDLAPVLRSNEVP